METNTGKTEMSALSTDLKKWQKMYSGIPGNSIDYFSGAWVIAQGDSVENDLPTYVYYRFSNSIVFLILILKMVHLKYNELKGYVLLFNFTVWHQVQCYSCTAGKSRKEFLIYVRRKC